MKKLFLLFLTAILAVSLFACSPSRPQEGGGEEGKKPEGEIDFTVIPDDADPVPAYSETVQKEAIAALERVTDRAEGSLSPIKYILFPMLSRAKISEETVSRLTEFLSRHEEAIRASLARSLSLADFQTLYQGVREILTADEIGKFAFEIFSLKESGNAGGIATEAPVCTAIGRDGFVVLARLAVKLLDHAQREISEDFFTMLSNLAVMPGTGNLPPDAAQAEQYFSAQAAGIRAGGTVLESAIEKLTPAEWNKLFEIAGKAFSAGSAGDSPLSLLEQSVVLFLKDYAPASARYFAKLLTEVQKEDLIALYGNGNEPDVERAFSVFCTVSRRAYGKLVTADTSALRQGAKNVLNTLLSLAGVAGDEETAYRVIADDFFGALQKVAEGDTETERTVHALFDEINLLLSGKLPARCPSCYEVLCPGCLGTGINGSTGKPCATCGGSMHLCFGAE